MTTETPAAEYVARPFVIGGLHLNWNGEQQFRLFPLNDDGTLDTTDAARVQFEPGKNTRNLLVGSVYDVETDGQRFRLAGAKLRGIWQNDAERPALVAAHRAAELAVKTSKRSADQQKEDASLAEALKPFRAKYRAARTSRERMALEVIVLAALRGDKG